MKLKRRINRSVGEKQYWKYYVEVPSYMVKNLNLKIGDEMIVAKQ